MESTDPFSRIEQALWNALTGYQPFAELVRDGNLIRNVEDEHRKPTRAEADLPEVRLRPVGGPQHLFSTSTSSQITQTWRLQIATATLHTRALTPVGLNAIKWQALCAMVGATEQRLGLPFVTDVRIGEVSDQDSIFDAEQIMLLRGWITGMVITVVCHFRTADIAHV